MFRKIMIGVLGAAISVSSASAQTVSIGTGAQGSLQYGVGAGIAKVTSELEKILVTVVPQGGPVVTMPLLNKGEIQFSIGAAVAAAFANQGRAMFKGRPQKDMRMVATLFPLRIAMYVRKDSPVKKIGDVRGLRMSTKFTKQKIIGLFSAAHLAMGGMSFKDIKGVPVPNGSRQVADFMSDKVDVVVWSISSGNTKQANASVGGIRVISIPNTPAAKKAMSKFVPGALIETINPAPVFPGVSGPTNIIASPFVLLASTKTPDDLVYKVIRTIHANKNKLVAVHKAFKGLDPKRLHLDIGVPYHPGALKFFKEKGI